MHKELSDTDQIIIHVYIMKVIAGIKHELKFNNARKKQNNVIIYSAWQGNKPSYFLQVDCLNANDIQPMFYVITPF